MNKLIIQSVRAHLDENQKLLNDLLKAKHYIELLIELENKGVK